jgi:ribosome maturation factor RimP
LIFPKKYIFASDLRGRGDESPLSFFPDMNFAEVKHKIEEWLGPELAERNLYLVDIKFPMGRQIEVYIDSDTGVQISECATISRLLEKQLDESGMVPENYILEVSSPGMSNPLRLPRQYKRRIGQVLEIQKADGTQLEGELVEADEDKIKVREVMPQMSKTQKAKSKEIQEPKEYVLKFDEIKKAVLQFKF